MNQKDKVIAIDGPGGSGKSSMARRLADSLGVIHIDTGAMFRAVGLWADKEKIPFEEGEQLNHFLEKLNIEYMATDSSLIKINGHDLTHEIRKNEVSLLASKISKLPSVRTFLLKLQRRLAQNFTCVMEGRDIGTVVFPEAFCKVFLTASVDVRAKRRVKELKERGETDISLENIKKEIADRDLRDSTREVAPLRPSEDAVIVDTSGLGPDEVLEKLVGLAKEKGQQFDVSF
jgi:cytidylate kinase